MTPGSDDEYARLTAELPPRPIRTADEARIVEARIGELLGTQTLSEAQKVAEASRQFEAVLLRQILGQARHTVFKSKLSPESTTSGIYQDMVTNQLAESISRSGSFGLARSLESQLLRQSLPPTKTDPTT